MDPETEVKQPKSGFLFDVWENFVDWTSVTTTHGARYLGKKNFHPIGRFFWIFILILTTSTSFHMIFRLYLKWQNSPTFVSFNDRSKPTWQIPFPAVTVCPQSKALKSKLDFSKIYHFLQQTAGKKAKNLKEPGLTFSNEDFRNYIAMSQVCDGELFSKSKTPKWIRKILNTQETRNRIMNISLNINDVFEYCSFKNTKKNCSQLFKPELTDEGVCFTFNILHLDDIYKDEAIDGIEFINNPRRQIDLTWTMDEGYKSEHLHTYPKRVLGSGVDSGLTMILKQNSEDFDYLCRGPTQGFKIQLHPPNELPNVRNNFFQVPLSRNLLVNVKPQVMETSEGLRSYKPEERQCYYSDESKLRFFKSYTKTNCEIECIANFTLNECGCVQVSMPHVTGTKICGIDDLGCLWRSQYFLPLVETGSDFDSIVNERNDLENSKKEENYDEHEDYEEENSTSTADVRNSFASPCDDPEILESEECYNFIYKMSTERKCNCLLSCVSINYEPYVSFSNYEFKKTLKAKEETENMRNGEAQTRISIFFNNNEFIPKKRSELFGVVDFLANCGGLLGLFLGISFISIVEIFYYILIRPISKSRVTSERPEDGTLDEKSNMDGS